jgi:hypothetical protein
MRPCRAKTSSWMCTVHIHSCNLNFYTTLYNSLFALRWVNCYGEGKEVQSHTSKWRGGVVTSTETVRQVPQCWWTTSGVNVRHKHKGTFPPHTKLQCVRHRNALNWILKTSVNFWSSQSSLLLACAQAAQGATEHATVLWLLLSCGVSVHFNNVHMIEILWHLCVPAACTRPGTVQKWESQCGHLNSANMVTAVSPVLLQMCDIVSWVRVKKWKYSIFITDNSMVFHLR